VIFVQLLNAFVLWIYAGIAMMPGITIYATMMSWVYLNEQSGQIDDSSTEVVSWVLGLVYLAAFLLFSWRHHHVKFDQATFGFIVVANAFSTMLIMAAVMQSMIKNLNWLHLTAGFNLILPVVLNLCIPNISALWVIMNPVRLLLHVLFLPTMQGYFLTLSIARTYDLSWGNRAGIGSEVEELKSKAKLWAFIQAVFNTALPIFLFIYQDSEVHNILLISLFVSFIAPITLISIGSIVELLGCMGNGILVLAAVPIVLCNGPLESSCGVESLPLAVQIVGTVMLVLVLKSFLANCTGIPKRFL